MPAAKKQQSSFPAAHVLSWVFGSGRIVTVLLLIMALFAGGAWYAWIKLKDRILAAPEYQLGPEQVEVTPQPSWIPQSDVRAEVFRSPTLDGRLSLMDDDLARRIADAFARHPWVAKVGSVTKKYGGVKVEVVYRKPVCMVQVPGGGVPVDAEAVLLPTEAGDFTPTEAARYPKLWGVDRGPIGSAGARWNDARVIGGAEIAAALDEKWEPMRLEHIEPSAADTAGSSPSDVGRTAEPIFTLVTRRGSRITWGYAPGANAVGELSAAEKVARLQHYFETKDSLDGPEGKPQQLNIRDLPAAVHP